MNSYQAEYNSKLRTIGEALETIRDGDVIVAGGAALEPSATLGRLHELAGRRENVSVFVGLGAVAYPFMTDPRYKGAFRTHCNFKLAPGRVSHRLGMSETTASDLHMSHVFWEEVHEPTVYIGRATPMDEDGYFRISISVMHEVETLERTKRVILEVNPNVPFVEGENKVHISKVDCVVEDGTPLPVIPRSEIGDIEKAIGGNIASLVKDGDTIQLGIGSIPDATVLFLKERHDLGIHTEMITNGMLDLIRAGAVTNRYKTLDPGKTVGAFVMGEQELYDFVDRNPDIYMRRGSYVNDPRVISRQVNMVSINNGLCADLGGQVCSESIGALHYSGSGGQFDTAYGAFLAPGGRNVIAMRSVAHTKNGDVPAITARLATGSVVTLPRNYVDNIVTEYGIARLKGRTVRERVDALIAVSHPDYRAELRRDAEKFLLW